MKIYDAEMFSLWPEKNAIFSKMRVLKFIRTKRNEMLMLAGKFEQSIYVQEMLRK